MEWQFFIKEEADSSSRDGFLRMHLRFGTVLTALSLGTISIAGVDSAADPAAGTARSDTEVRFEAVVTGAREEGS